jgi:osmotically-inducible protein OsmY
MLTDSDLEKEVQAKIYSDPQLRAARLSVSANATRGIVRLSGNVESDALRTKAVGLARTVRRDITIEDRIEVRPAETAGTALEERDTAADERKRAARAKDEREKDREALEDAWIQLKILKKLVREDARGRKIEVDVKDNVVTLSGTVTFREDKSEAARIARKTEGVIRVVNRIEVVEDGDEER